MTTPLVPVEPEVPTVPASFEGQLKARLDAWSDAQQAKLIGKLDDVFRVAAQPDTSRVPAYNQPPAPARVESSNVRLTDMRDYLYQRMPAEVRAIRNPKTDELMGQWIAGLGFARHDVMDRAALELHDYFRATQAVGTSTAGGLLSGTGGPMVPQPLANLIVLARNRAAKMRSVAQMFTTNNSTLRIPITGLVVPIMLAESGTYTQVEATNYNKNAQLKKMVSFFRASQEMLRDSAFNLVSLYSERAGSAFGEFEDNRFCQTNGTPPNPTEGFIQIPAALAYAEALSTVLTYEDVVGLFYALAEPYRAGAMWFADSAMCAFLATILDGNGRPIFGPSTTSPQVVGDAIAAPSGIGGIFGRPVISVPVTAGELVFGNPSFFGIVDWGGGIEAAASEHSRFITGEVEFRFMQRIDSLLLLDVTDSVPAAFRRIQGITSVG